MIWVTITDLQIIPLYFIIGLTKMQSTLYGISFTIHNILNTHILNWMLYPCIQPYDNYNQFQPNDKLRLFLYNPNFIFNTIIILVLLLLLVLAYAISILFIKRFPSIEKYRLKLRNFGLTRIMALIATYIVLCSLECIKCATAQITSPDNKLFNSLSIILSYTFLFIFTCFPIIIIILAALNKMPNSIKEDRYTALSENYKLDSKHAIISSMICLLERIFIAYMILFSYSNIQHLLLLFVSTLVLLWLMCIKPYKENYLGTMMQTCQYIHIGIVLFMMTGHWIGMGFSRFMILMLIYALVLIHIADGFLYERKLRQQNNSINSARESKDASIQN